MKATRAQIKIIKQQESMLSLMTMIAGAVGLEAYDVQEALGTAAPIEPNKTSKLNAKEVAELEAVKTLTEEDELIDGKSDIDESTEEESDPDESTEPNNLPKIINE